MADENRTINPLLLRNIRGPLARGTNTIGAGIIDPNLLRQLQSLQPRIVGGMKGGPGFNPSKALYKPEARDISDILSKLPKTPAPVPAGMGPQPDVNLPPDAKIPKKGRFKAAELNPAIVPYIDYLKQEGIPYNIYVSPVAGSAYIRYGPEGNKKVFTIRVPHPDRPHTGRPNPGENIKSYIDTAGVERLRDKNMDQGMVRNAAGGSFSDINNVKDAIKYNLGRLVPVGSEPLSHSPDYVPKAPPGPAFHPKKERTGQANMMGIMLHKDEQQKLPTIMGGNPNNALHSQQLNQRFNLVTPQDLGNYGSQEYDPYKDPKFLQLMQLVKKYGRPPGNDQ